MSQGWTLEIDEGHVDTPDGWRLHLKRTWSPPHLDTGLRPLLIVPGYGMNGFIFGFHPGGTSMERSLAERGFEVWTVNLRGMGPSRRQRSDAPTPSLRAYAEADLPATLDYVLSDTHSQASRVDVIGASLGGSIVYAYLALTHEAPIGSVVTLGAPLRWEKAHPLMRVAFGSSRVARRLRFSGTQRFARRAFPVLARVPGLLDIYMNTAHVDMSQSREMTKTVDDPQPSVNRDIAKWLKSKDMVLRGVNITRGLGRVDRPLLVVISNRDGLVPEPTALSVREAWGGRDVQTLEIGTEKEWFAHADLFIAHSSPQLVFEPIAHWLRSRRPISSAQSADASAP